MLIQASSTTWFARKEAGGKGYNLFLLTKEGHPVPRWVILGASHFSKFRTLSGIDLELNKLLLNPTDLKSASDSIRRLILETKYPEAIETEIRAAYTLLGSPSIAVRSSASDEDSTFHSFAGQLSTYLFVTSEANTLRYVKECWASAFSERVLSYRVQNNLSLSENVGVAVVLQEMIDCEKSGVVFTCDPIRKDGSKLTINAVYGIGEGLVSGLLDADTYVLDKQAGTVLTQEIPKKETKLVRGASGGGTQEVPVPQEAQDLPVLNEAELRELASLALKVEKYYRYPQDIEWGWKGDRLYLLQSRPVTTPVTAHEGTLNIWDNSNIVESYGGLTLPLTFTFARYVYHRVYVQFCEILMVPKNEIQKMDLFLRNMLGLFYGRVYYNLLNWYRLTSILPGYKYNRSFMETMMGTHQSLADEIAERIKPSGFQAGFTAKAFRFLTGLKFVFFHFTAQGMVDRFLRYFRKVYDNARSYQFSQMTADEIYAHYQSLDITILRFWKPPIINDYLCMVHFGLLKKLTGMWLSHLGDSLQNDLLCGEGNLESAEPTRELLRMAAMIQRNEGLKQLMVSTPNEDCLEAVQQSSYREFHKRVRDYIDQYGFRCMSEMKLEQKDLHQDPTFLFACLKNYLRTEHINLSDYEQREKDIRSAAENKVFQNLSVMRRLIYRWSLRNARRAVRNRENLRFCRTRIYGVVRAMFYGIGKEYALRSIIGNPTDIFYLTLDELAGSLEGTLTVQNLHPLIALRKAQYEGYSSVEPASRFVTRGPVYWMNDHTPREEAPVRQDISPNCLQGTGCCPGIIEGKVKVILSSNDDMALNGEILVTLRTDPGWIPLYPSISGLLVERGGLLSHSAIVAREMGLPTIVGIKGLTQRLKTGMRIRFDGQTGVIEILN